MCAIFVQAADDAVAWGDYAHYLCKEKKKLIKGIQMHSWLYSV